MTRWRGGAAVVLTIAAVVLTIAVAACGAFGERFDIVDGWSVGEAVTDCASESRRIRSCDEIVALAREREPDAPGPGRVFREGGYPAPDGGAYVSSRSGGSMYVVVFAGTDGSRRATGVYCGVFDCRPEGRPAAEP